MQRQFQFVFTIRYDKASEANKTALISFTTSCLKSLPFLPASDAARSDARCTERTTHQHAQMFIRWLHSPCKLQTQIQPIYSPSDLNTPFHIPHTVTAMSYLPFEVL